MQDLKTQKIMMKAYQLEQDFDLKISSEDKTNEKSQRETQENSYTNSEFSIKEVMIPGAQETEETQEQDNTVANCLVQKGPIEVDLEITGKVFVSIIEDEVYIVSESKIEKINFNETTASKLSNSAFSKVLLYNLDDSNDKLDLSKIRKIDILNGKIVCYPTEGSQPQKLLEIDINQNNQRQSSSSNKQIELVSQESAVSPCSYDANEIRQLLKSSQPVRFRVANLGDFSIFSSHPKSPYSLRNYCKFSTHMNSVSVPSNDGIESGTTMTKKHRLVLQTEKVLEGGSIKIELILASSKDVHNERKASEIPEYNNNDSEVPNFNIQLVGESSALFIPLRLVHLKGACLNQNISVAKMLIRGNESFKSNYSKPVFIFENLHESEMFLENVTIAAEKINNSGEPIGNGLIFTSNYLGNFSV